MSTAGSRASANDVMIVTGASDDELRARYAALQDQVRAGLSDEQRALEAAAEREALARNREIIARDLEVQKAKRAEAVRVWDDKIAETERMIAALDNQGA